MEGIKCPNRGEAKCFQSVIQQYSKDRKNLIPILHAIHHNFGSLTEEAAAEVAAWLDIPTSEVYGVSTFYTLFTVEEKGKHVIRLCDSPPCHIVGSEKIAETIENLLGVKSGETTADGLFTYEIVSCFGLCGVAPAMMIDGDVYGNLEPSMIPDILNKYKQEGI